MESRSVQNPPLCSRLFSPGSGVRSEPPMGMLPAEYRLCLSRSRASSGWRRRWAVAGGRTLKKRACGKFSVQRTRLFPGFSCPIRAQCGHRPRVVALNLRGRAAHGDPHGSWRRRAEGCLKNVLSRKLCAESPQSSPLALCAMQARSGNRLRGFALHPHCGATPCNPRRGGPWRAAGRLKRLSLGPVRGNCAGLFARYKPLVGMPPVGISSARTISMTPRASPRRPAAAGRGGVEEAFLLAFLLHGGSAGVRGGTAVFANADHKQRVCDDVF